MDTGTYKYRGFISYSHQDRRWGEWLHKGLERYRVPARLVGSQGEHGPVPARLYPIFRDREELPTAGALGEALSRALRESHCFVLVCSPAAAASRWVNEEVLQFKRLGGESRILCLIVDGEPNATAAGQPERECFPPALRFKLDARGELTGIPAEPLAADARPGGDGREPARLKIIAGLLGIGFGELRQRDLQARNRRLGLLAGVTTAVAALTIVLAVQALLARRAAEKSRQQGEDLIGFMLGDLRSKLEPLGKLDILDAVGDKAMAYFDQLDSGNLSEAALTARAKALRQIGDVRMNQGRPAAAVEAFDSALALNQRLASRHPDDADLQFELGQSEYWVGYAALTANQLDRAESHFVKYQQISGQLVRRAPDNAAWQLEAAYAATNLGALKMAEKQSEEAIGYFRQTVKIAAGITPQTAETRHEVANALSWQGTALQKLGRIPEAIAALEQQAELERAASRRQPDDMRQWRNVGGSLSALGYALIAGGEGKRALAVADEGLAIGNKLVANDATNQRYRVTLATHAYIRAEALAILQRWAEARQSDTQALALLDELHQHFPKAFDYRQLLVRGQELAFDLALRDGERAAARRAADAALAVAPCGNEPDDRLEASRIECAHAQLLGLELAGSGPDAERYRTVTERALGTQESVGDRRSFAILRARLQILIGQAATLDPEILKTLSAASAAPDTALFLARHCDAALEQALGQACKREPSQLPQPPRSTQ